MNRNLLRITSATIGIILLFVIVLVLSGENGLASQPGQSLAETEEPGSGFVSHRTASPLAEGSSATIWTKEAMLAAKPYPLEKIAGEVNVNLELSRPDGPPGVIASSPPGIDFSAAANSVEPLAVSETTVIGYNYPAPYARYQNFDSYETYPYSTVGVLFFKQGGGSYRCSAASIGNFAIWTAGHCIHAGDGNPGTWSTNVIFVPAYQNGNAPLGVWTAGNLYIPTGWQTSHDLRYDMGGAILNLNGGQKISQEVGSLGFAYNMDHRLHWTNIAYPSEAPFTGSTQQICSGSFAYEDMSGPSPFPIAIGCDMTGGSSGGPWILDFSGSAGSSNLLNGNNSYRYPSHPKELFSPYFGSFAQSFHNTLISAVP
ncbi:MAG: trypsin-like serine peptidase [Anaerolineales bacterium]